MEFNYHIDISPNSLRDIAYGNGMWIAVGLNATILKSADAENWEVQIIHEIENRNFNSVTYSNGKWVIGGDRVVTSTDGKEWFVFDRLQDPRSTRTIKNLNNRWFIGGTQDIYISDDGLNWTEVRYPGVNRVIVDFEYGNGKIIAVGGNNSYSLMLISEDNGKSWSNITSETGIEDYNRPWVRKIKYNNGLWVVVAGNVIGYSEDGYNWKFKEYNSSGHVTYEDVDFNNGKWVAAGNRSTIAISDNGKEWSVIQFNDKRWSLRNIEYLNSEKMWMVHTSNNDVSHYLISNDGENWFIKKHDIEKINVDDFRLQSSYFAKNTWIGISRTNIAVYSIPNYVLIKKNNDLYSYKNGWIYLENNKELKYHFEENSIKDSDVPNITSSDWQEVADEEGNVNILMYSNEKNDYEIEANIEETPLIDLLDDEFEILTWTEEENTSEETEVEEISFSSGEIIDQGKVFRCSLNTENYEHGIKGVETNE